MERRRRAAKPLALRCGAPHARRDAIRKVWDGEIHAEELRWRGSNPRIAKRGTPHGSGLGIYRWVVERAASWLRSFRKLRLRTDRIAGIHEAFVALASSIICTWFLKQTHSFRHSKAFGGRLRLFFVFFLDKPDGV
jgi:hypothetical protein